MNDKEKLMNLIFEEVERYTGNCFICQKMGWKCPVIIPEDYSTDIEPNFENCDFRQRVCKTLTIEQ